MDTQKLLDDYTNWLRKQYVVNKLEYADEIDTPFLNSINDRIRLYAVPQSNGRIQLTDDGNTLNDLSMLGFKWTDQRINILNSIRENFNIDLLDDILSVSGNQTNFPNMKQRLISAILEIDDMSMLKHSNVSNLFFEDILNYFNDNDFGGLPKYTIPGKSGVSYDISYVIPEKSKRPRKLIEFENNLSFNQVAINAYKYNDIRSTSKVANQESEYTIIYNPENQSNISSKIDLAAKSADINLIPWNDKKRVLLLK